MRAARLHELGKPLRVEDVPVPEPGPEDVLVEVRAAFVPALLKGRLEPGGPFVHPTLPATMGYNAAGVVASTGSRVQALPQGTRVFVNPLLAPQGDEQVQVGEPQRAGAVAYQGDFAFTEAGRPLLNAYPGAFAEYVAAPAQNMVCVPDHVPFEQAARMGYLGIAVKGLRYAGVRAGSTVLINGATGTIGVGAVLLALAMGAARIVAVARDPEKLRRLERLEPRRITAVSLTETEAEAAVQAATGARGADALLDALPTGVEPSSTRMLLQRLRKGATAVLVGGADGKLDLSYDGLAQSEVCVRGSQWGQAADFVALAQMVAAGVPDLSVLDTISFRLDEANEAVEAAAGSSDGFKNVVVVP